MTPLLRVKHFDSFDRFFSTQFTISPKSTQRQETRGQRIGFQIFEPGFREEVPPENHRYRNTAVFYGGLGPVHTNAFSKVCVSISPKTQ